MRHKRAHHRKGLKHPLRIPPLVSPYKTNDPGLAIMRELQAEMQRAMGWDESKWLTAKFWGHVQVGEAGECWPWIGPRYQAGYGSFQNDGKREYAHRFAFGLHYGIFPKHTVIMHTCDNPPCVNPAHLWPGTPADNMRDRDEKGRHRPRGRPPKLTKAQVLEIRERRSQGESLAHLSVRFGVAKSTICEAALRKSWRHVTQIRRNGPGVTPRSRL